jgi:hypothetical protein
MSIAAKNASTFYSEVAKSGVVWSIKDEAGFPAPVCTDGKRTMPFWSSESRARSVIENVPAYKGFKPIAITWSDFSARWVPGLTKDGLLAGVNWSGKRASGFDVQPEKLRENVEVLRNGT